MNFSELEEQRLLLASFSGLVSWDDSYFFPGDIEIRIRGLNSAQGREFIEDLPLSFLSSLECSWAHLLIRSHIVSQKPRAFEAVLVYSFMQRHEPDFAYRCGL